VVLFIKKVIFLVDMNAFFISCEITRNPALAGRPSAVAGDPKKRSGIILAANYEARACGVKTAMVLHEALKLCPKLQLVPPDHRFYSQKSKEVMELLAGFTPVIEQNSIDEAWLDMTGTEKLFGSPKESSKQIMKDIKEKLGLWCSIGIAENKFLAKMASEIKKPMGITELWEEDIPTKLWPLPVKDMYGIGSKTSEKLNKLGIITIGDLAGYNKNLLVKTFGKYGNDLHLYANGIDNSPVEPHKTGEMKSIGRSTTLSENIIDIEKAKLILMELADDVSMSARKYDKKGRTLQITLKYSDFHVITRQATFPATHSSREVYENAVSLLEQNWSTQKPVRLLGISLSGFDEEASFSQLSLFDTVQVQSRNEKQEQLDMTLDKIKSRLGTDKIGRAALLNKKHRADKP